MFNKKKILANIMFGGFKYIMMPIVKILKPFNLYILAYHRVSQSPGPGYLFDKGTISATPNQFERQIVFLKKRFHIINFDILSNMLSSGKPLPNNLLVITFDDGYADNYTVAFKILKKHNLTATIFVSTHYIDSGMLFWFDRLSAVDPISWTAI